MPIPDELTIIIPRGDVNVFWENEMISGVELQQIITRRDEPRSRRRWQFADRREHRGALRKVEKE